MAHYRLQKASVKWTDSASSQTTLLNVQQISIRKGGQVTNLGSDGDEYVEEKALHDIDGTVTVTLADQVQPLDLVIGAGTLVFELQAVATGIGASSGTDQVFTSTNAVLTEISADAMSRAGGGAQLTIELAADSSGDLYTLADAA